MKKKRVDRGFWNLENLKIEASKYRTIKEFRNGSSRTTTSSSTATIAVL
jgi:hypothetical protein